MQDKFGTRWNHKIVLRSPESGRIYGVTTNFSLFLPALTHFARNETPKASFRNQMINSAQDLPSVAFVSRTRADGVHKKCHAWRMALIKLSSSLRPVRARVMKCINAQEQLEGPHRVRVKWNFNHDSSTNTRSSRLMKIYSADVASDWYTQFYVLKREWMENEQPREWKSTA